MSILLYQQKTHHRQIHTYMYIYTYNTYKPYPSDVTECLMHALQTDFEITTNLSILAKP